MNIPTLLSQRLHKAWMAFSILCLLLPAFPVWSAATVATTTTLASSIKPSQVGQTTVLTATVTGTAPTGTVTFKNGTTTLATKTLSGTGNTRTATYNATFTTVATNSLTAVYAGDATNKTSTSSAVSQVVNKKTATATVASSLNPSTSGASVTFTATVVGYTPTGTVTFKDGTTTLGTATLAGTGNTRTATYVKANLTVASHSITVVYAGNTLNTTATSAALSQVVNPAVTTATATLASSLNPSTSGASVTFTASITGNAPTGTVTFKDGTTTLGTGTLSGTGNTRTATYANAALSVASHSITAVYAGDSLNTSATSAALSQVVNKKVTTTTLGSSLNPSNAGASITLSATVSGNAPTGTVTFKDGATTIGTGTLSGGVAALATSTLGVASHSITAAYGGDTNNATSTSGVLTQTVTAAQSASTTLLSATPNPATVGQSVTISASVTGTNPSGNVTFLDGSTPLGSATLSGTGNTRTASLTTSALGAGGHSVVVQYAGDSANQASTANLVVTVNAAGPGTMTWQYGYDAMGRPTIQVDPNGNTTNTYYDALGRPIQIQEPANTGTATPTVTNLEFNAADSLTKVTDPRNLATTYTPDGLGQVKTLASPDSGTAGYTYDANGNLLTKTDARGKLTTYTYDALNRLSSITYTSGTPSTLEYDGGASPYPAAAGELTKVSDASGSITYAYDSAGRLTTKTQVTNSSGGASKTFVVAYTWGDTGSALDKITAITYPSGSRVNYSYDQYGSVSAITTNPVNPNGVGTSGTLLPLLSGITTNVDNNVSGWSWASGKTQAIGYDSFGQVSGYNLGDPNGVGIAAGVRRTITRDAAGRITAYTHTNNGASQGSLDQSFGYDNLNRLLNANMGTSTIGYSYDATGNRTSKVISGTAYTNTVSPASNRYTQVQDVSGTAAIQTDAAGNITNDGVNTFTYGDRGRLGSVTTAGGAVAYSYNAQELRVAKSGPSALVPTGAAYYVYDEAGKLLGEYDANANPIYETVYLGAMPVGLMKQTGSAGANTLATNLYNVYADHLGAPRIVTRSSDAAIVWRWDSAESFGGTAPNQNPSNLGAFTYNQRLPGQTFDAETGLFQNWNREYNARIGRYMQSDPIGLRGGINTYAYVEGDPLNYSDPEGLLIMAHLGGVRRDMTLDEAAAIGSIGNSVLTVGVAVPTACLVAGQSRRAVLNALIPGIRGQTKGDIPKWAKKRIIRGVITGAMRGAGSESVPPPTVPPLPVVARPIPKVPEPPKAPIAVIGTVGATGASACECEQ